MKYYFLTLFPEIFETYFTSGMMAKAIEKDLIAIDVINIRDYSGNKHHKVDDTPYGGGAGMVMAAPPIIRALESIDNYKNIPVIFPTPSGRPFIQEESRKLAKSSALIFICGHYEGVDQRIIDHYVDLEFTLGDYVLTGGELPALTMADAIARNIAGFLGNDESLAEESFESGLLEYPQYTKPRVVAGAHVPDVLLSGHHAQIKKWRLEMAIKKTKSVRPDLYRIYEKNLHNK